MGARTWGFRGGAGVFRGMARRNRGLYGKALWGLAAGVLLALCNVQDRPVCVEQLLICVFGGVMSPEGPEIHQMLVLAFPMLLQLMLFGSAVQEDMEQSAVFLFTRSYSRRTWMLQKLTSAAGASLLFGAGAILAAAAAGAVYGIPVQSFGLLMRTLFCLLITGALWQTALILLMNVLCVRFKPVFPLLLLWAVYVFGQFAASLLLRAGAKTALALLPFAQGLLILHAGSLAEAMPELFLGGADFFTAWFSLAYQLVLFAAICYAGVRMIRRKDFFS